jgi:hypothetical protein
MLMAGVLNSEVKKFCWASYRGWLRGSKGRLFFLLPRRPCWAGRAFNCGLWVRYPAAASHENRETFGNTIGTFLKKG